MWLFALVVCYSIGLMSYYPTTVLHWTKVFCGDYVDDSLVFIHLFIVDSHIREVPAGWGKHTRQSIWQFQRGYNS